jgi:hypothetical protein
MSIHAVFELVEVFGIPELRADITVAEVYVEGKARGFMEAVEVVFNGENAGIVTKAKFG